MTAQDIFSPLATTPSGTVDCWFLTGPTASGKTAVGLELAKRLNAEIISLDSMAIYIGMDIGVAKPTERQRRQIPHHLLDLIEPTQEFSVSQYLDAALAKIADIRGRGREPLFVGGSALYLKALLRGLFQGPPADWEFRRKVEEEVERVGLDALHQRLQQVDPLSAAKLHPHDKRRMIRALEVYKATGRPISHLQTQFEEKTAAKRVFAISWPRPTLHDRIETRVGQMFADGIVEETERLLEKHQSLGRTASQAIGYREVIALLHGECGKEETVRAVKARTRQFARRQETWFRHLGECRAVPLAEEEKVEDIVDRILEMSGE